MQTVLFDTCASDDALRREQLYNGQIFVFSPRPTTIALCDLARELTEAAFDGLDPRQAQFSLSVEEFVNIVAPLKPRFIHHPQAKPLIQALLQDMGCEMAKTYFDVPRMRVSCHGTYLNAGVAYPLHPHRDTWYSAPMSQLNWWMPLYDINENCTISFQPRYWHEPLENGSADYNHYDWNRNGRKNAAQHVKKDTRKQPRPEETVDLAQEIRVVCPPGGIVLFSGAQLHWTVPNSSGRTRFSIDFRTVNIDDIAAKRGAPNLDSHPQGTTLRELMRADTLSPVPAELVNLYENTEPPEGDLVFKPTHLEMATAM